jgi:hypothetical protein
MSWSTSLFGATLLVKDGEGKVVSKPTAEALAGKKYVALYFSAHVSFFGPPRRAGSMFAPSSLPCATETGQPRASSHCFCICVINHH